MSREVARGRHQSGAIQCSDCHQGRAYSVTEIEMDNGDTYYYLHSEVIGQGHAADAWVQIDPDSGVHGSYSSTQFTQPAQDTQDAQPVYEEYPDDYTYHGVSLPQPFYEDSNAQGPDWLNMYNDMMTNGSYDDPWNVGQQQLALEDGHSNSSHSGSRREVRALEWGGSDEQETQSGGWGGYEHGDYSSSGYGSWSSGPSSTDTISVWEVVQDTVVISSEEWVATISPSHY